MAESYLRREVEYWRARALEAEQRLKSAADLYPDAPPEPPVGTRYLNNGKLAWERRDDGWHCGRDGCRNCPCEWLEVVDYDVAGHAYVQVLPEVAA